MNKDAIIHTVQQKIETLLSEQEGHFLVDIRIKPTNNIKVFLDGDTGVGIDNLVKYNKALYKLLEEDGMFPDGDFSLEVSSAGLDEPLKMHRQYVKNTGRNVQVTLLDSTVTEGKLISVDDDSIAVEETKGKGKKAETIVHTIPFSNIKTTIVQIKF